MPLASVPLVLGPALLAFGHPVPAPVAGPATGGPSTLVTPPGFIFCTGDGFDPALTSTCPCANLGAPGNGCASSFNPSGAHVQLSGTVFAPVLDGSGMNSVGSCIFLKGDQVVPTGLVFGDGLRCVDGSLIRLAAKPLALGTASFPDAADTVTFADRGGTPFGSGLTAFYTVYYRNSAAAFCPPATFNATNATQYTF